MARKGKIGWGSLFVVLAAAQAFGEPYKTLVDLPVSAAGNPAYLVSAPSRPWWNAAWTRRAPILVSSSAKEPSACTVVDCVVDFGEPANPDEVRVVTPWETEVPCVCEARDGTKLALLFKTPLRIEENRPFLVYWGNPAATRPAHFPTMAMSADDDEVRMANGQVDVTFDNRHRTPGFLRTLRIVGSQAPNELLERATGYAWRGFAFDVGGKPAWGKARVLADNAFKKEIAFDCDRAELHFVLYADQPRLDYRYALKGNFHSATVGVSFACGGGVAYDQIVYPGANGEPLAVQASLDRVTDSIPALSYDFTDWISSGWFALRDRTCRDVVGLLFDRAAMRSCSVWSHGQAAGENFTLRFDHKPRRKNDGAATLGGSGALVALMGTAEDVMREYARAKDAPTVLVGKPEAYAEHPVRVPRLDRDYVADFNIGPGPGAGWASGEALAGTEWASNLVDHIRSYGANCIRLGGMSAQYLPVPKDLDASIEKAAGGRGRIPAWNAETFDGSYPKTVSAAAHAKGMAVNVWSSYLLGYPTGKDRLDPALCGLSAELQGLLPKCGFDAVHNGRAYGEGPLVGVPSELVAKNGADWRKWKDLDAFFDAIDRHNEINRRFYAVSKKLNPDVPVLVWNAENGEASREMFMGDYAGCFDSCMVEMLPRYDFPHVKTAARRMRALFGNEAGRTVHHHYYFFEPDQKNRVSEIELPFLAGVNGFSHENLTYENYDRENSQVAADFHRFAEYTGLGAKVARMGFVRDLAVLRDGAMFRHDMRRGLWGGKYKWETRTDYRIRCLSTVPNLNFDIVVNRYFTAKDLAPYNVVFVPEDDVLSDGLAGELLAFVREGGGALVEGATVGNALLAKLGLADGEVREYGKGKICWLKDVVSDRVADPDVRARFLAAVGQLGGKPPYAVDTDKLDVVLQASDEGLFLGVYNAGTEPAHGRVVLNLPGRDLGSLFVLDVKRGVVKPYADGVDVSAEPRQCGYYLVGDASFTALPEVRRAEWSGAALASAVPNGNAVRKTPDPAFRPCVGIEVCKRVNGRCQRIRRSHDAGIDCVRMAPEDYVRAAFVKDLARAKYLHLRGDADAHNAGEAGCLDAMFAECGEELAAFLKRGGGILFDSCAPGPLAEKFLADVGVGNPYAHVKATDLGGGGARWGANVTTNHPLYAASGKPFSGAFRFSRAFAQWDERTQFAPIRATLDERLALVVVQDGVLGAGKVAFAENRAGFTDWYENVVYGDNLLSWLIGMPVETHKQKSDAYHGGPGQPID